jgi:hypothetical protein
MDGRPSPDETAYRGLCEELGFSREDVLTDPPRLELKQLGLFLDVRRWQPVFCYLAIARMPFEQIIQRAAAAKDSFESPEIIAREWSIRNKDTRSLLIGTDGRYRLASNHAEVALLLPLLYKDGVSEVAKWLGGQVQVVLKILNHDHLGLMHAGGEQLNSRLAASTRHTRDPLDW